MELVRRLSHHPEVFAVWRDVMETKGVRIQIGNMGTYQNPGGPEMEGKSHPNAILTDWLCACIRAHYDGSRWLQEGGSRRSDEDQLIMASPSRALLNTRRLIEVPLDGLALSTTVGGR